MLKEKWLAAEAKKFTFIVVQSVGISNASICNYPHTHKEKSSLTNTESSRVEFSIRLYSSRKNIIPIDLMLTWAAVAILSFDVTPAGAFLNTRLIFSI